MEEKKKTLEIDPKTLKAGMCYIDDSLGEKLAICKSDDDKIRIYKVIEKEETVSYTHLTLPTN